MSAAQSVPSMLEQALAFVRAGWAVFPLQPRGKQPIGTLVPHGVKDASKDESMVRRLWGIEPHANIGLACGDGIVVIDIDGPEGRANLDLLEAQHGVLPITFAVRTGRDGGLHLYFRVPRGMDVSNRSLAEGLDVRADGAYVVSHGSVHANGRTYDALDHTQPMAELPAWLCDRVRRKVAPKLRVVPTPDRGELDRFQAKALASALERCRNMRAGARHDTYRDEVHGLAKCGTPRELVEGPLKVLALASGLDARDVEVTFADAWAAGTAVRVENPAQKTRREFCADVEGGMPIGEARRKHQVSTDQARAWGAVAERSKSPKGQDEATKRRLPGEQSQPPGNTAEDGADPEGHGDSAADHPVPQGQGTGEVDAWIRTSGMRTSDAGGIAKTTANLALIARGCPGLAGALRFNAFSQEAEWVRPSPWPRQQRAMVLDDLDGSDGCVWIQATIRGASYEPNTVGAQLEAAARLSPYDPLRLYLDGLEWDRRERLETMLVDMFGCVDSEWARTVGRRWMISAVARAMNPGCKADCVLVIEGAQGARKSSGLRVLAGGVPGAFLDEVINPGDKDSKAQCAGTWIWELQEMQVFARHEASALKAFFSKCSDTFRPPYARRAITLPRRTVFAVTLNPEGGGYLSDTTGNRRYWPVAASRVDLEAIERDRDQLWAEAVHAFRAGAQWWLTDGESEIAQGETTEREAEHPWDERLGMALKGRATVGVTVAELLKDLGLEVARATGADGQRIASFLRRRGWKRRRVGETRVSTWFGGT